MTESISIPGSVCPLCGCAGGNCHYDWCPGLLGKTSLPDGSVMGWICPKCGAVNSPLVFQCPCTPKYGIVVEIKVE